MTRLIGITGPARSGKDTLADCLIQGLPAGDWCKMSFAEPLKTMLAVGLGISIGQLHGDDKDEVDPRYGVTPRYMMQTLGTDWGRNMISPEVWLKSMDARAAGHNVIIPDVRFESEAAYVRERGVLVHITGRGGLYSCRHVSEGGVALRAGDWSVDNSGDQRFLRSQCHELLKELTRS